ncbi:MAG: hypothetical protein ACOX8W_07020 [bacterium]|jgi:hypothetical protein
MQVKIFFHSSHRHLEAEVNNWLSGQLSPIEVIYVTQASSQTGRCITVWYQKK